MIAIVTEQIHSSKSVSSGRSVPKEVVLYVEGFLLTPGHIDLSELQFVAVTSDDSSYNPVEDIGGHDDPFGTQSGDSNDVDKETVAIDSWTRKIFN
jgi:hypothetical protein